MEIVEREVVIAKSKPEEDVSHAFAELNELQLGFVGGGIGDVVFG